VGNALVLALGLMLVLEGVLPFLNPGGWRQVFQRIIALSDGQIRFFGLASMVVGLVIVLAFG
jgi:uncharacterized protein YjeT (DUF2065 family)